MTKTDRDLPPSNAEVNDYDFTGSYDPIDIGTAIHKLEDIGFPPDQIAMILDKDVRVVRAVITQRSAPTEDELGDEVRRLVLTAIRRAHFILDYGTGEQRMRVIMACVTGATRMLNAAAQAGERETRTDFLALMGRMRDVPVRETVMTHEGAVDVEARAVAERTQDQD